MELNFAGKPYEGKELLHHHHDEEKDIYLMPYHADDELVKAVEVARLLKRPLLLRGEPGCGKTRLAEALAFELYGNSYQKHYFTWSISSTSKAKDGIYTFDHVGRLRDAHLSKDQKKEESLEKYVRPGPLGKSIKASTKKEPSILLIDEIDKADIDFPNDLLDILDWKPGKKIEIQEAGLNIDIEYPPIVIITSNDERELPKPFLRRCIFHYIEFPNEDKLTNIAKAHLEAIDYSGTVDLERLISEFIGLRERVGKQVVSEKLPSTSELIDWLFTNVYYKMRTDNETVEKEGIAYPGVLLKTETDYRVNRK